MIFKKAVVRNVIKDALKISGDFFAKTVVAVKIVAPLSPVGLTNKL
jgi:hypothetical protein